MGADQTAGQRAGALARERDVLLDPQVAALAPVAVGDLVAKGRPQADLFQRALQRAERAANE